MANEPSAAQRIRDSIAALPERHRTRWDDADKVHVYAQQVNAWIAEATSAEAATHIALLASPHVGEALANLLEALDWLPAGCDVSPTQEQYLADIRDARRDLAAAINREQT